MCQSGRNIVKVQVRPAIKRRNTLGPEHLLRDEQNAGLRGYLLRATVIVSLGKALLNRNLGCLQVISTYR